MGEQHFSRGIVPAIQIKCVLIQQELAIYQEAEVPRERTTIQLKNFKMQSAACVEFLNDYPQELLKLRSGAGAFPAQQCTSPNVMNKEIVKMLLCLGRCREPAKGYLPGLLQLIVAPPGVVFPQQGAEYLLAVFLKEDRFIASSRHQFHSPAQVPRQLLPMADNSTVFRKVLKDALVPVLDRLKQRFQRDRENLFLSPLLTQQICVVSFGDPEKLDRSAALHQGKNANDLVPFKDDWAAKRKIIPIRLPPGSGP